MPPKPSHIDQDPGTAGIKPSEPEIDTVFFRDRVRVDGNTFLAGIGPEDKRWQVKVIGADRVVLVRCVDPGHKFHGLAFVVPFENVLSMRLKG